MKRDERLIRKALLGLREGEPDAGFPDRTEKNRELAAAYAPLQPVVSRTGRRRKLAYFAAAFALILTASVTAGVLWQSQGMLGFQVYAEQVTSQELHTALDGVFTVYDEIGEYTIDEGALVFRNKRGNVVYSKISYSSSEGGIDLTLIAISKYLEVIEDTELFLNLKETGEINGFEFRYELFEVGNEACASIDLGNEKRIWIYVTTADEKSIISLIDVLTRSV